MTMWPKPARNSGADADKEAVTSYERTALARLAADLRSDIIAAEESQAEQEQAIRELGEGCWLAFSIV